MTPRPCAGDLRVQPCATPGPWTAGRDGNNRVYGPDGDPIHAGLIAVVYGAPSNKHLIAAAPDLYEAMSGAMQWLEETLGPCDEDCQCLLHSFRAAIAKAEVSQ